MGRVRAGVVSPCCFLGGADLWTGDLLEHTDKSRIHWVGCAIRDAHSPIVSEVRESWEKHAPVAIGPDAIRSLARAVDVLVVWGVFQSWGFPAAMLAPLIGDTRLLVVSHGAQDSCLVPSAGKLLDAAAVGVSQAALEGLPRELRGGASVILNAIAPGRVRRVSTREAMRAGWDTPPGVKVAGWLGRFADEKRPRLFIDAVAALPAGWIGVMAGIGYSLPDDMRYADQVAPGRIRFLGGRHDVGDVLSGFDALVMPSQSEACSLAAGEAWLAGCPLVSTPVGLLRSHPGLARLVPLHPTGEQLAAAILADGADRYGTAARVASARRFCAESMSTATFGRRWTDRICEVAPRPAVPAAPGLLLKAGNFLGAMRGFVADGGRLAPREVRRARRATCDACPFHATSPDSCTKCGCGAVVPGGLSAKLAIASSFCPDKPPRWVAV